MRARNRFSRLPTKPRSTWVSRNVAALACDDDVRFRHPREPPTDGSALHRDHDRFANARVPVRTAGSRHRPVATEAGQAGETARSSHLFEIDASAEVLVGGGTHDDDADLGVVAEMQPGLGEGVHHSRLCELPDWAGQEHDPATESFGYNHGVIPPLDVAEAVAVGQGIHVFCCHVSSGW